MESEGAPQLLLYSRIEGLRALGRNLDADTSLRNVDAVLRHTITLGIDSEVKKNWPRCRYVAAAVVAAAAAAVAAAVAAATAVVAVAAAAATAAAAAATTAGPLPKLSFCCCP